MSQSVSLERDGPPENVAPFPLSRSNSRNDRENSDAESSSTGAATILLQSTSDSHTRKEERASLLKGKVDTMREYQGLAPADVKMSILTQQFHSSMLEAGFVEYFYARDWRKIATIALFMLVNTVSILMDGLAFRSNRNEFLILFVTVRVPTFIIFSQGIVIQFLMTIVKRCLRFNEKQWRKRRIWNLIAEAHYFLSCWGGSVFLVLRQAIYGRFGLIGHFPTEATSILLLSVFLTSPRSIYSVVFSFTFPIIVIFYVVFNKEKVFEGQYWFSFIVLFATMCASIMFSRFVERRLRLSYVSGRMATLEKECAEEELKRSEKLKENIFPLEYAAGFTLAREKGTFFHKREYASVLFSDIRAFSSWCKGKTASYIVDVLNMLFSMFDQSSELLGITKCKTIGDAFVAFKRRTEKPNRRSIMNKTPVLSRQKSKELTGGSSKRLPSQSNVDTAFALDMLQFAVLMHRFVRKCNMKKHEDLSLRIGVSVGDIECLIFGQSAITFDLFGEQAEFAEHLEQKGIPGCVHVSTQVRNLTKDHYEFVKYLNASPDQHYAHLGSTYVVKCKKGEPDIITVTLNGIYPRQEMRRASVVMIPPVQLGEAISPSMLSIAMQEKEPSVQQGQVHDYASSPNTTADEMPSLSRGGSEKTLTDGDLESESMPSSPMGVEGGPTSIVPLSHSPSGDDSSSVKSCAPLMASSSSIQKFTGIDPELEVASPTQDDTSGTALVRKSNESDTNPFPLLSALSLTFWSPRTLREFLRADYTASLREMRAAVLMHTINSVLLFISLIVRDTNRVFSFATRNLNIIVAITFATVLLLCAVSLVIVTPLARIRLIGYSVFVILFVSHLVCTGLLLLDRMQYVTHYEIYGLWLLYISAMYPMPMYWLIIFTVLLSAVIIVAGVLVGTKMGYLVLEGRAFVVPLCNMLLILVLRAGMATFSMRSFWYNREVAKQLKRTRKQQEESDALILSVLPPRVAKRMEESDDNFSEEINGTVAFLYLVGFDKACEQNFEASFAVLNDIFSHFDTSCLSSGVHKVKSIRNAYLLYSSHSEHAELIAELVLEFTDFVRTYMETCTLLDRSVCSQIKLASGINSGDMVGGVLGRRSFLFDVFSSTVNQTQRLAAGAALKCKLEGRRSCVLISPETKDLLESNFALVDIVDENEIDAKGFGRIQVYGLQRAAVTLEFNDDIISREPMRNSLGLDGIDAEMSPGKQNNRRQSLFSESEQRKFHPEDNLDLSLRRYTFGTSGLMDGDEIIVVGDEHDPPIGAPSQLNTSSNSLDDYWFAGHAPEADARFNGVLPNSAPDFAPKEE